MKKKNGYVLEWERDELGFEDINAQAMRRAITKWEKARGIYIEKLHSDFFFGNKARKRKQNDDRTE